LRREGDEKAGKHEKASGHGGSLGARTQGTPAGV